MRIKNFVSALNATIPDEMEVIEKGINRGVISFLREDIVIKSTRNVNHVNETEPLKYLYSMYNVKNKRLGICNFLEDVKVVGDYEFFGVQDIFYYVIDRQDWKVKYYDSEYKEVTLNVAKDFYSFLDVLVEVVKYNLRGTLNENYEYDNSIRIKHRDNCINLSGGIEYYEFYNNFYCFK